MKFEVDWKLLRNTAKHTAILMSFTTILTAVGGFLKTPFWLVLVGCGFMGLVYPYNFSEIANVVRKDKKGTSEHDR
jgi:hypothetical protein